MSPQATRRDFLSTTAGGAATVAMRTMGSMALAAPLALRDGSPAHAAEGAASSGGPIAQAAAKRDSRCWSESLFLMDNWFHKSKVKPQDQVELTAQFGYSGMTCSMGQQWKQFPTIVKELDRRNLALVGAITGTFIHTHPQPKLLERLIQSLRGRDTQLMISLRSKKDRRGDKSGDARAADVLRWLSDIAEKAQIGGIAIYPTAGVWMETVTHGVRLCKLVNRPNVGVMFNQYHWMMRERRYGLEKVLRYALPHLKCVTVNGSDNMKPDIRPLGQGSFDTLDVLKTLAKVGYKGEVGAFGHGLNGKLTGKLKSNMDAWQKLCKQCGVGKNA